MSIAIAPTSPTKHTNPQEDHLVVKEQETFSPVEQQMESLATLIDSNLNPRPPARRVGQRLTFDTSNYGSYAPTNSRIRACLASLPSLHSGTV